MSLQPPGHALHPASSPTQPERAAHHFLTRLEQPCRLLVAYSGGGDSTGLLAALRELRPLFPDISISAATVDHGLRQGSAEEARKAGELCRVLGVPHATLTWRGAKPATGIQAAARSARYRLLANHARREKIDFIVTAHNLDDQSETLAMRRLRNPDAAGGISDAVLVERAIWVVRPFLGVRRADIRRYLEDRNIGWIEDPSNDNTAFERARIRQMLATTRSDSETTGDAADLSREAARLIGAAVRFHRGHVAEVDLGAFSPADPGHRLALLSLAAFLGGRSYLAGKGSADRIFEFLVERHGGRLAAERVILDKRGQSLFIGREARGLSSIELAPGGAVYWDGRFHLANEGGSLAVIGAGTGRPLIDPPLPGELPKTVLGRAEATMPRLISGDPGAIRVRPVIAQFEHFLPASRLELAEALAQLAGLEPFPSLSLG